MSTRKKRILRANAPDEQTLALSCPVTFDAASLEATADADGKPRIPTFEMLANTGVPMRVGGFDEPLIVRLSGAKFARPRTPIIMDHDVSARIGHTTEQSINLENSTIPVKGVVSSSTKDAKEFVVDAKNGFPFQASISGPIHRSVFVPAGKTVNVNGKEWKGPLNVVESMSIREISVTVLGADGNTETRVAASMKRLNMNPELKAYIASLGLDPEAVTGEQLAKLTAAFDQHQTLLANQKPVKKGPTETVVNDPLDTLIAQRAELEETLDRINDITASYADAFPETATIDGKEYKSIGAFKAAAIRKKMTSDAYELALMRCSRANATNQPGLIVKDSNVDQVVLEASLARKFNLPTGRRRWVANCGGDPRKFGEIPSDHQGREYGLEAYYKPDVLEKSHDKQYNGLDSIQALLDLQCRAAGKPFHGYDRGGSELVAHSVDAFNLLRASGFSTLNVPNMLENLMHKFALAAFDGQDQTWRAICGRKNLSDFRPHNMYRLNFNGHFRQVSQDGQLKHVSMTDSKYAVQADTFGAMLTIDRKTIKNDDLGMIIQKASGLGMLGAMRIEQSVYTLLLANPGAFFSSTLGNYISGSTSALDQTGASTPASAKGLDQARRSFRNQVINGYPIGLSPKVLLGGTTMETQMYQLWAQETFAVAGVSGSVNWLLNKNEFQGLYRPVVTPYLNNTALTDDNGLALSGQSNTQWYLFCDPNLPQGSAIVIGFLDGRDQPYFDQADTQFNVPGGIQFRAYLDWGVAMNVYQLALKSAGA